MAGLVKTSSVPTASQNGNHIGHDSAGRCLLEQREPKSKPSPTATSDVTLDKTTPETNPVLPHLHSIMQTKQEHTTLFSDHKFIQHKITRPTLLRWLTTSTTKSASL